MELDKLPGLVHKLMVESKFAEAEELLLKSRQKATEERDFQTLEYIFTELIGLCHISDPPLLDKAELLSNERERLMPSAYNKLQTAIILQQQMHDVAQIIIKLEEAIAQGKVEHDDKTIYTSLGLIGQIHLDLGHTQQALAIFRQLEDMVGRKGRFVVGDETCFLEALRARNLETDRVARLASTLMIVCKDASFKERLMALAARR